MAYKSLAEKRKEKEEKQARFQKGVRRVRNGAIAAVFLGAGGYFGAPYAVDYVQEQAQGTMFESTVGAIVESFNDEADQAQTPVAAQGTVYTLEDARTTLGDEGFVFPTDRLYLSTDVPFESSLTDIQTNLVVHRLTEALEQGNTNEVTAILSQYAFSAGDYRLFLAQAWAADDVSATELLLSAREVVDGGQSVSFIKETTSPAQKQALRSFMFALLENDGVNVYLDAASEEGSQKVVKFMATYALFLSEEELSTFIMDEASKTLRNVQEVLRAELTKRQSENGQAEMQQQAPVVTPDTTPPAETPESDKDDEWNPYTGFLPNPLKWFN